MTDIPQTRQHLLHGLAAAPLAEGAKLIEKAQEGKVELQLIQQLDGNTLYKYIYIYRNKNRLI